MSLRRSGQRGDLTWWNDLPDATGWNGQSRMRGGNYGKVEMKYFSLILPEGNSNVIRYDECDVFPKGA